MIFCLLDDNCCVWDRRRAIAGITRMSAICEGCRNRTRSELNLLRYDYVDLSQAIVPADTRNNEALIFRPKPESTPPLDVAAFTLRSTIAALLVAAEDAVRHLAGDRHRRSPVREGFAVDQAVRYLDSRVDTLAVVEHVHRSAAPEATLSGVETMMEFGALHRRARRAVGLLEPVVSLPGPCPECGASALRRRDDGTDRVWCQQCHTSMTISAYQAAMRMQFAPVTTEQRTRST